MDLDKLKKVAKEKGSMALKRLIHAADTLENEDSSCDEPSPIENLDDQNSNDTQPEDIVQENASDDVSGETRRFNLNDVLNNLKSAPGDQTYNEVIDEENDVEQNIDPVPETSELDDATESGAIADMIKDYLDNLRIEINSELNNANEIIDKKLDSLDEHTKRLNDIYGRLGTLNSIVDKHAGENTKSAININGKLNAQDVRLNEISNALGSVSKLNDSIFDLKNSQMNTKNSLSELESSYAKLKRKMTAGVTIISILSAIIVILEVINLLS